MPRFVALLIAAILFTTSATTAMAEIRFADMVRAIRLGGTERMMVFALDDPGLPRAARGARQRILYGIGIGASAGNVTRRSLSFAPILTWDSNINGGYGRSEFVYGGLPFTIGKEFRAVGGVLIGGGVDGALRMGLGGRTGLELRAGADAAWSPEHDLAKLSATASACGHHMLDAATWGYACLDTAWRQIDLGETTRQGTRIGLNRIFFSDIGIHELTVELQRNRHDGGIHYDQDVASLSMTSALPGGHALVVGSQIGARVEHVNVLRDRFWVGLGFGVSGRPASITVGLQRNRGGTFLGEAVEKQIRSVNASYRVREDIGLSIYGATTDSNLAFYRDNQIGISVDLRLRTR